MSQPKNKPSAFCYSYSCTGKFAPNHSLAVKQDVRQGTSACPKCGYSLMWTTKSDKPRHQIKKHPKIEVYLYENNHNKTGDVALLILAAFIIFYFGIGIFFNWGKL